MILEITLISLCRYCTAKNTGPPPRKENSIHTLNPYPVWIFQDSLHGPPTTGKVGLSSWHMPCKE